MPSAKKRLLITISYSFTIRYIYRSGLLHKLNDFCTPVICLTWEQPDLMEELKKDGFEVYVCPENKKGRTYTDVRHKIDIWFKYFRLKSPSKKIQATYIDSFTPFKKKYIRKGRELYNYIKFCFPHVSERLLANEKKLLHTDTNYSELEAFVDSLHIDAVFSVTPFHRQEDILLRVCEDKKKLMLTAILSFDNITKRGWIPVVYDMYIVWNKHNKKELQRIYPDTPTENIHVAGAVQFDFYFKSSNLLEKGTWEKMTGLSAMPRNRKIILYAGGPRSLFPQEPDYLKDIDEAINDGDIPGNPVVLFRCHPIDNLDRWKKALGDTKNVVFDASWTGEKNLGETNITDFDIKKLCSTLYYTDVHINLCSTMTVDGSAFNKPQIGPAYFKDSAVISERLYKMYWQEHFAPIMQTGAVLIASSKKELIKHINNALNLSSEDLKASSNAILESVITYTDGNSTERVYGLLKQYLQPA